MERAPHLGNIRESASFTERQSNSLHFVYAPFRQQRLRESQVIVAGPCVTIATHSRTSQH
jgi:hypothetical protein